MGVCPQQGLGFNYIYFLIRCIPAIIADLRIFYIFTYITNILDSVR